MEQQPKVLDLVVCGVGAGATAVYDGGASSSFMLRLNNKPILLLDVGSGVVRQALNIAGILPDNVYISHNHTDHAGELPVMLAVEAQKGHRMTVMAEPTVLNTLVTHRLHELKSTGRHLSDFGHYVGCPAGKMHDMGSGLGLLPLQSRHAERCFGLLLYYDGQPVLGWSADSGYDAALYSALSAAPVLLLDGRPKGTAEHAGFAQLGAAASSGLFRDSKVYVYGYGTQHDAPDSAQYPSLQCLRPGNVLLLSPTQSQQLNVASDHTPAACWHVPRQHSDALLDAAAAAAAVAAAEATAAAEAAAAAAVGASVPAAANAQVELPVQQQQQQHGQESRLQRVAAGAVGLHAAVAAAGNAGLYLNTHAGHTMVPIVQQKCITSLLQGFDDTACSAAACRSWPDRVVHDVQHVASCTATAMEQDLLCCASGTAAAAAVLAAEQVGGRAAICTAGFPGVLQQHGTRQQQQLPVPYAEQHTVSEQQSWQQQQQQLVAALERQQHCGAWTATSTSCSTTV